MDKGREVRQIEIILKFVVYIGGYNYKLKIVIFFNKIFFLFNLLLIVKVKSYRMLNLVYKNVRLIVECKQSFRNLMGQLGFKFFEFFLNYLYVFKVDFYILQGIIISIIWSFLVLYTFRVMSVMVISVLFLDFILYKSIIQFFGDTFI